jgi:outer membrane protein OmpA-like peptidoglycan-associated protein
MTTPLAALAGACLSLLLAVPLAAQGVPPPPSRQQIEDALDPPWWRNRDPNARSWSSPRVPPDRGVVIEGREAEGPRPAINLHIPFAFDSATVTPEGLAMLATLAQALGTPRLASVRIRLVGHTDARGSDDYNQTLSERRAAAVREVLIRDHRIDALRMEAMGRGERELVDPGNPYADVNRRVQVINVGP